MTPTTPERWDRIKVVFQEALELEVGDRERFLDQECGGDQDLRSEVESLLTSHEDAGAFLERSAVDAAALALADEDAAEGGRIGAYRLVREIGRGGMGTVYLAEREGDDFHRRVAIKLISRGMDTDAIVRRFRRERQILAGLDHPFIGRLYDGGASDDGRPYFVMEHVQGLRIDAYCRTHDLSVEDRLRLFCKVCDAVQFAHGHLIVHRDLKPGNILVTAAGVPKLLDFGLASLVGSEPGVDLTRTMTAVAMTPEYASPEQIRGEPLTTATDVYSLGVILYELLTGHHPYPFPTRRPDVMARIVCEQVPARSSASVDDPRLRKRLRGDLDTILATSLQKQPERRYASARQLAEDIWRHLDGMPVLARPDTAGYRAKKFVRRHTIVVGAAALLALTLISGIAATTWQARRAEAERARAERRFDDVRRLARLSLFDYNAALLGIPGTTPIRERMVRDAFAYLELLTEEAEDDPTLRAELAEGYDKVGEVQARMGDIAGSLQSHRRALLLHQRLAAGQPEDIGILRGLAFSHEMVADRLTDTGDAAGALAEHRKALDVRGRILAFRHDDPLALRDVWSSTFYVGRALQAMGAYRDALVEFRQMLGMSESMLMGNPTDPDLRMNVLTSHHTLAGGLTAVGDLAGAAAEYRRAVEMSRALLETNRISGDYRQALSRTIARLARTLGLMGDHEDAFGLLEEARSISELLSQEDPSNAETKHDLIWIHAELGYQLAALGRMGEALARFQAAVALGVEETRRDPAHARTARALATAQRGLGDLHLQTENAAAAVEAHGASTAILERLSARDFSNVELRHDLAEGYERAGRAHQARATGNGAAGGDRGAACAAYEKSRALWEALRREGTLRPASAEEPARVARLLAACGAPAPGEPRGA